MISLPRFKTKVNYSLLWLLLSGLFLGSGLHAQEQNDPRWISTWATSPSTLPRSMLSVISSTMSSPL